MSLSYKIKIQPLLFLYHSVLILLTFGFSLMMCMSFHEPNCTGATPINIHQMFVMHSKASNGNCSLPLDPLVVSCRTKNPFNMDHIKRSCHTGQKLWLVILHIRDQDLQNWRNSNPHIPQASHIWQKDVFETSSVLFRTHLSLYFELPEEWWFPLCSRQHIMSNSVPTTKHSNLDMVLLVLPIHCV